MMRQELWTAILASSKEIDRRVAAEVGDRSGAGRGAGALRTVAAPPRTRPPQLETAWRGLEGEARQQAVIGSELRVIEEAAELERDSLDALQLSVRAELNQLWARLEGEPGFERIRRALLIYFDERVMGELPDYRRLSWPLLQTEVTGSTAGGDDFYRFMEAALDDPRTPSLVFEVHYFCLRHGFRGRYAKDLAQVEAYERRLLQRIELPQPPTTVEAEAGVSLREPWPAWVYYAIAALVVIGVCVLLTALSNYEAPPTPSGAALWRWAS